MLVALIIFIAGSVVFLVLIGMMVRIRDFRFDLFRIRDEVRYAFFRELHTATDAERITLREQFENFQALINTMLKYPTSSQVMIVDAMLKPVDDGKRKQYSREFLRLPLLFQRQMTFLAIAILKNMGIKSGRAFIGFVLRTVVFAPIESRCRAMEEKLTHFKLTNSPQEGKNELLSSGILGRIREFKDPADLAEVIVSHSDEVILFRSIPAPG